ncbi:MAG: phospholipid/cholesterol/gamma-HCH transport system substrate-binding protein [Solirubrobacteraceae bacterium]|jgi:ABC-type transporter Mla subunit MlaD|nr:phospholipid/cholesterol/gamma-HCH transport system substrate-binding protein [Solirubrobacteraceae bacterium]
MLALVVGAVAVYVVLSGRPSHEFSTVVPAATGLVNGQRISDGSKNIGEIKSIEPVDGGRKARLNMAITDDKYWPLAKDTTIDVRLGGTVSFSNRYLYLIPGKAADGTGTIAPGGTLDSANVHTPIELDTLINNFGPKVQGGLEGMVDNSADVFDQSAKPLNDALGKTAPVAQNLSDVFGDLIQDKASLTTLVDSTNKVVTAVNTADPDLRTLLDGTAKTFDAIADESGNLKVALDRFPAALVQTRETLGKAEGTLENAADITDDLAPGITQLRKTTVPLVRTLNTLRQVTPLALQALTPFHQQEVKQGGDLLATGGSISGRLTSLLKQADTQGGCIRPWTPEIVLLGTNWGDWISPVDDSDHLLRATLQNYLPAQYNNVPYSAGDAAKAHPGLTYGFPRPPGALANQPWYQPQCGVGPDSEDPSKDVEGTTFKASQLPPANLR